MGEEFQVAAILPIDKPTKETKGNNQIPITLHLSKTGTDTPLGCIIYSIYNKRNDKVHQTVLNNSQEILVDLTKKIGSLISKKYCVPVQVSMSGSWNLDDLLTTVKSIVDFIEQSY